MNKQEIYDFMNQNRMFSLATLEGEKPHVRIMMLFSADEHGIVFHTSANKDIYQHVLKNSNAELCFTNVNKDTQVRISGQLEIVDDNTLKDTIAEHPTRQFVKEWRDNSSAEEFYPSFIVMRMHSGKAHVWTFETNFAPKEEVTLD